MQRRADSYQSFSLWPEAVTFPAWCYQGACILSQKQAREDFHLTKPSVMRAQLWLLQWLLVCLGSCLKRLSLQLVFPFACTKLCCKLNPRERTVLIWSSCVLQVFAACVYRDDARGQHQLTFWRLCSPNQPLLHKYPWIEMGGLGMEADVPSVYIFQNAVPI